MPFYSWLSHLQAKIKNVNSTSIPCASATTPPLQTHAVQWQARSFSLEENGQNQKDGLQCSQTPQEAPASQSGCAGPVGMVPVHACFEGVNTGGPQEPLAMPTPGSRREFAGPSDSPPLKQFTHKQVMCLEKTRWGKAAAAWSVSSAPIW